MAFFGEIGGSGDVWGSGGDLFTTGYETPSYADLDGGSGWDALGSVFDGLVGTAVKGLDILGNAWIAEQVYGRGNPAASQPAPASPGLSLQDRQEQTPPDDSHPSFFSMQGVKDNPLAWGGLALAAVGLLLLVRK